MASSLAEMQAAIITAADEGLTPSLPQLVSDLGPFGDRVLAEGIKFSSDSAYPNPCVSSLAKSSIFRLFFFS